MPTVRGPLFALNATGTLADLLTFRQGRNGVTVHPKQRPKTRHSSVELANRVLIAGLNLGWSTMNDYTRNLWNDPDRFGQTSPRLAYIRHNAILANAGEAWGAWPNVETEYSPMAPEQAPAEPPPTLTVSGTLSPDATGRYSHNGELPDGPIYERADGDYWISPLGDSAIISELPGVFADPAWWNIDGYIGDYAPVGAATGTATVTGSGGPPAPDVAAPLWRALRITWSTPRVIVGRTAADWLTEVHLNRGETASTPSHNTLAAIALATPSNETKTLLIAGLLSGHTYSLTLRNHNRNSDISPTLVAENITVL